jgi:hypothetical protein
MAIIGPDELTELDEHLRRLFQTLHKTAKPAAADVEAARRFLEWVIYPEWEDEGEIDLRPIGWSPALKSSERELLKQLTRSAAALVKSPKDREKTALVEQCKELLKTRGIPFAAEAEKPKLLDRITEARDKFVYQKICKGVASRQIVSLIDQHPEWLGFASESQVIECAAEYARRHGLPLPPG